MTIDRERNNYGKYPKDNKRKLKAIIRLLNVTDKIPYELLLDADPSKKLVDSYMAKAQKYIAVYENKTIVICVLVKLNEKTIEIKNVAIAENLQVQGIGTKMIENAFHISQQ